MAWRISSRCGFCVGGVMIQGKSVSKVAIMADPREPDKLVAVQEAMDTLLGHLELLGVEAECFVNVPVKEMEPGDDVDLFVVMGGDGTMIHFAARLSQKNIPFYGLNYGNVGFMMNNPAEGLDVHARRMKTGDFFFREFPVLGVKTTDLQGNIHHGVGLNDIYLQRMTPQSCKANITLSGQSLKVNPVVCDGIVVATPLGSTAYNYNVTGSMVSIDAPVITLTPVAALRTCPVSCMMLPMETVIEFDILEPKKRRVQVVSDGMSHGDLTHAEIRVSDRKVRICFDKEYSRNLPIRFINKACS